MKLIILTPGIKEEHELQYLANCKDGDRIFITNPLYQEKYVRRRCGPIPFLLDKEFLDPAWFEEINALAKHFAMKWPFFPEVAELVTYHNINMGTLIKRLLVYYFVGLMKAIAVYEKLLSQYEVSKIFLFGDQTYWTDVIHSLASSRNIPCLTVYSRQKARDTFDAALTKARPMFDRQQLKEVFRAMLQKANRPALQRAASGNIIYSASLRFVLPFLALGKGGYYLRETFSIKAYQEAGKFGFCHIIPGYFLDSNMRQDDDGIRDEDIKTRLDLYFRESDFFVWRNVNLWEFVKKRLDYFISSEFPLMRKWIIALQNMLQKLDPSAVVVEEDVCVFNRLLVQCANARDIPSFVMLHGVPYFDIMALSFVAKYVLVWGPSSKKTITEWGKAEERVLEVGAPQYCDFREVNCTKERRKFVLRHKNASGKRIILLALPPFRTNEHPDFLGSPLRREAIEQILERTIKLTLAHPDIFLVIKFHPADRNETYIRSFVRDLGAVLEDRICFLRQENIVSLIASADAILTYGSTVYQEALLLRKPVWTFDHGLDRNFGVISDSYLDLSNEEDFLVKIFEVLDGLAYSRKMQEQEGELLRHFVNKNEGVPTDFEEIMRRVPEAVPLVGANS